MFTQFLGSYLLKMRLVDTRQLMRALEMQRGERLRLGVLAQNKGYMTAAQVEELHKLQRVQDIRIGKLALEKGYLTTQQLETLLEKQAMRYHLLGEALVRRGCMTQTEFDKAAAAFLGSGDMLDDDVRDAHTGKLSEMLYRYYHLEELQNHEEAQLLTAYLLLLFNCITRFVGDDFSPLEPRFITYYATGYAEEQCLESVEDNAYKLRCLIDGNENTFTEFAARYKGSVFDGYSEETAAATGEFLSVVNSLFCEKVAQKFGKKMRMRSSERVKDTDCRYKRKALFVPVCFSFGTAGFVIGLE
ncbi:MAG: hypothetical protein PHG02_10260 [Oscillospiraceae bacterium]|nr:hypothetical protein [Oscillospiraceae bacterium]